MYEDVSRRLSQLISNSEPSSFSGRRVGLEKETLRIDANGVIAQSDHPAKLGAALCNSAITTDFSEALLEMVTPPCESASSAMDYLQGLHQFILPRLADQEGLWNTSMPCVLQGDSSIRVGEYGSSHNGRMKRVYRLGLGLRYGKRMQAIAGIHFNFSLPEDAWPLWTTLHAEGHGQTQKQTNDNAGASKTDLSPDALQAMRTKGYFHMTRNLMRVGWIVPYLFGASPAICQTFLPSGTNTDLSTFNQHTRYAPKGTSLRMGEIGYRYKEDAPIDLGVRHDDFEHYLDDIIGHVTTSHPPYLENGVKDALGEFQQLNANKLQIENEYYSSVRPKQIPEKGEMPILALQRRGIRYLELRSVDVNVFDPVGMHLEQVAMLEMLMMFSWLADCAPLGSVELEANKANIKKVAHYGREPSLMLQSGTQSVALQQWGLEIMHSLKPLSEWLDAGSGGDLYQRSLASQIAKLHDPSLTPSARVIAELEEHGSFFDLVMHYSQQHQEALMQMPANDQLQKTLDDAVLASIESQQAMDANSVGSFEDYLSDYFSQLVRP